MTHIAADQIILATQGEYDDFRVIGIYKAVSEFDSDVLKDMLPEWNDKSPSSAPASESYTIYWGLMDKLVEMGLVERVPAVDLYLGQYGRVSPEVLDEDQSEPTQSPGSP